MGNQDHSSSRSQPVSALLGAECEATDLIIPVNGVYFDQIKAGTKTEEYRLVKDFWSKRLEGREYRHVIMTRGFPKADKADLRVILKWRGFVRKEITHPHFGPDPVEVYAIDVSEHIHHG